MAKFDPCAVLPDPTDTQAVWKSTNRFGCFYASPHTQKTAHRHPRPTTWDKYTKLPIYTLNKKLTAGIATYWSTVLSPAQRTAWATTAATASWLDFAGNTITPNGFELFVATNRIDRYWVFTPTWNGAHLYKPAEIIHGYTVEFPITAPQSPWSQPAAPNITYSEVIDGYWIYLEFTQPPDPYNMALQTVQATNFQPPTGGNPRSYIATNNTTDASSDPGFTGIYFDFPRPAGTPRRSIRLGARFYNVATHNWSDPIWILATS